MKIPFRSKDRDVVRQNSGTSIPVPKPIGIRISRLQGLITAALLSSCGSLQYENEHRGRGQEDMAPPVVDMTPATSPDLSTLEDLLALPDFSTGDLVPGPDLTPIIVGPGDPCFGAPDLDSDFAPDNCGANKDNCPPPIDCVAQGNCANYYNPGVNGAPQTDTDNDGKGDHCDATPEFGDPDEPRCEPGSCPRPDMLSPASSADLGVGDLGVSAGDLGFVDGSLGDLSGGDAASDGGVADGTDVGDGGYQDGSND